MLGHVERQCVGRVVQSRVKTTYAHHNTARWVHMRVSCSVVTAIIALRARDYLTCLIRNRLRAREVVAVPEDTATPVRVSD